MNDALRSELLAMQDADLSTRTRLIEQGELHEDRYHPEMRRIHEANNRRIQEIIEEFGWPLARDVGEDGAQAVWLIVQHAVLEPAFQERCLELLRHAVAAGEAPGWQLAYLEDRVLIRRGKRQRYGCQHEVVGDRMQPLPTESMETVNERRAALGMGTLETHTARLQKAYDQDRARKAIKGKHSVPQ